MNCKYRLLCTTKKSHNLRVYWLVYPYLLLMKGLMKHTTKSLLPLH